MTTNARELAELATAYAGGTITASLDGNAATATTLQTARTINGVSFNGTADITVADATKLPLAGGTMTGTITNSATSLVIGNSGGVIRGYLYNDSSGFGLLTSGGGWAARVNFGTANVNFIGSVLLTSNATSIRQSTTSTWSGDAGASEGKLEYHSNRWYVNAGSSSTLVCQFRRGGTDVASISNTGVYSGSISGNAATATTAANAIGVGQTWQTPSRAINTTYTNTTGRSIFVFVSAFHLAPANAFTTASMVINGNGYEISRSGENSATVRLVGGAGFVIPAGATYRLSSFVEAGGSVSLVRWAELR
jgi:hypothetical protein